VTPVVTEDGWLQVPYDGPELAVIEMETPGGGWQPAYLDWNTRGERVAQVRWDGPLPDAVHLRVDGVLAGSYP
jgi:hypothetical protein